MTNLQRLVGVFCDRRRAQVAIRATCPKGLDPKQTLSARMRRAPHVVLRTRGAPKAAQQTVRSARRDCQRYPSPGSRLASPLTRPPTLRIGAGSPSHDGGTIYGPTLD